MTPEGEHPHLDPPELQGLRPRVEKAERSVRDILPELIQFAEFRPAVGQVPVQHAGVAFDPIAPAQFRRTSRMVDMGMRDQYGPRSQAFAGDLRFQLRKFRIGNATRVHQHGRPVGRIPDKIGVLRHLVEYV